MPRESFWGCKMKPYDHVTLKPTDTIPAWTLTEKMVGSPGTVTEPACTLSRDDEFPLDKNFGARHLVLSFDVCGQKYSLLLFTIASELFNGIVKVKGGKPLGPKHGFIVDLHLENKPITSLPILHRERWYPTREKANAAVKELFDLVNSLTIEEIFNLDKLPDFQCPRAGANG